MGINANIESNWKRESEVPGKQSGKKCLRANTVGSIGLCEKELDFENKRETKRMIEVRRNV